MLKFNLTPGYISGLVQTDGSFFCVVSLSANNLFGLQFRPKFAITADLDSKYVLLSIKDYFNCGVVTENNRLHTAEYIVDKLEDLIKIIIPHFIKYPVFCAKLHSFELFYDLVSALYNKTHRSLSDRKLLLIKALSMNVTTNRKKDRIDLLFSKLNIDNGSSIPLLTNKYLSVKDIQSCLSEDFIAGVIDGDGSVHIIFTNQGKIKPAFSIKSDSQAKPLLDLIRAQLGDIGSIQITKDGYTVFMITGIKQIVENLIPFLDKNPLFSERANHYKIFREVSLTLYENAQNNKLLSLQTKLDIVEKAYNMNKKGKRRLLSKEAYIKLLHKIG